MINADLIKDTAKKLDNLLDCNKFIKNKVVAALIEMGDGYVFSYGLDYINTKFGEKIPVQYVDNIEKALTCFNNDDYQGILNALPETLDEVIDIKQLDDDLESIWIATNFKALLSFIKYYANKKTE